MAYTTFSTDNADYVLQLGNHVAQNRQVDIFEGIDALVVETGGKKLQDYVVKDDTCASINALLREIVRDKPPYNVTIGHPQLYLPFRYCAENQIPVFGTDTDITLLGSARSLFSDVGTYPIGAPMDSHAWHYSLERKKINNFFLRIYADWRFLLQDPLVEGRNAVNARKIEEFVAPLIAERPKRKPHLGLIFGAAHMGLKPDLQSKRRRDFTIRNWRDFNFGNYTGFIKEDLNLVQEANHNGNEWAIQTYTPNLFD